MTDQVPPLDVARIRQSVPNDRPWPPTQAEFAARFGLSAATVRDWEQGRRRPDAAARALLALIAAHPDEVGTALDLAREQGKL